MTRLPQPGSDDGTWGAILNDYLAQSHKPDGTIKDNAVSSSALQAGAVTSTNLAPGAVTASAIADDAVTSTQIQDGTIQEAQLAGAVTTKLNAPASIADGSVSETKLASAVQTKLNDRTIADNSVTNAKVATNAAISADKLADGTTNKVYTANEKTKLANLSKSDVGLGNVDDTSDNNKPVSAATQTALNAKLDIISATFVPLTDPAAFIASPDNSSRTGLWGPGRASRPLPPPSRVITRFANGHGWSAGSDDTSMYVYGDRSYRCTTNGSGGSLYAASSTFAAQDWSTSFVRLVIRFEDTSRLQLFQVYITMGSGNTVVCNPQSNPISGEWAIITMPRSQFTVAAGTANWANVTQIQMRFQDKSAGAVVANINAVELLPDQASLYPNGVFILEADDGYIGQKNILLPIVSARGIPVTLNIIADRFTGSSPLSGMTADDLRTLQNRHGWVISNHSYAGSTHSGSPSVSQLESDFLREKHWLHANGLHYGADDYALCPGTGSPVSEGAVMEALRRNFRSVRVNSGFYETALPADPLKLRSLLFTGNTNSQLQTNIDAVAGAGGAFIFTLHDVITGSTNGSSNGLPAIGASNLATILDYAASRGMVFRTRADYLERR